MTTITGTSEVTHRKFTFGAVACVVLVLLAASALLLFKLGAEPLQDYDEATYAEVATENIASSDHLSFTFLGTDYFRKPPLLFWLMDVSESLVTNQEAAARLPSALSGILLVGVVILMTAAATDSLYTGALAGAVLTTTGAFIEPARQARFDILVSLFIMAAVYAFMRGFKKRYWYVIFGAVLGLSFLTKGPLAIYAVVAVLGAAAVRGWQFILGRAKDPYFWGGVLAFFVVVAPWHIYMSVKFGYAFWEEYLGDQVLNRVGQILFNGPTNSEYFGYLFGFAAPWACIFCIALVCLPFIWKKMPQKALALSAASLAGVAMVLLVCLLAKTKAISYLIPLYPFMAIVIALVAAELYRAASRIKNVLTKKTVLRVSFAVFAILFVFATGLTIWNGYHINPYYGSQLQLAVDEKAIGEDLLRQQPVNFYEFNNTTTLGSIMYYSRLLTPGTYDPANPPASGSFVLYQTTDQAKLFSSTPGTTFTPVYTGKYLSLAVTQQSS